MTDFDEAVYFAKNYTPEDGSTYKLSTDLMLEFYGLYKQATVGPCIQEAPSMWNVEARKKHNAWAALGDMSVDEAKVNYVNLLTRLKPDWKRWTEYYSAPRSQPKHDTSHVETKASHEDEDDGAVLRLPTSSATPRSAGTAIYDDFTATKSSQRPTPNTIAKTLLQRLVSPAGALIARFVSPAQPGSDSYARVGDESSVNLTTTPGTPMVPRPQLLPRTQHTIRWSYSPNQELDVNGRLSYGSAVESASEKSRAIDHTAAALRSKMTKEELSRMCAQLQMQVAQSQLALRSTRESLEFYVGALHGIRESGSPETPHQQHTNASPQPVNSSIIIYAMSFINNFYGYRKIYPLGLVIVVLLLLLWLRKRMR